MPKVVAIIQARLGSSRFPRKVLANLDGKPVLQHVIERAKRVLGVDAVVVASPHEDAPAFIECADKTNVTLCGPSGIDAADVIGRFAVVAAETTADVVVRVTADCPLFDPDVAALVLRRFRDEGADFATNDVRESGYPDGLDVEVFTRALLERANREAVTPFDREHVTAIMPRLTGVRVVLVKKPGATGASSEKFSIDTPEDLARVDAELQRRQAPVKPVRVGKR
ncbi:MAG: NTP transferase domain-containing protein [Acidobacteria bacterium]|nr:NTP transferase domain-containing protein [Acidobacteriota bacterium]